MLPNTTANTPQYTVIPSSLLVVQLVTGIMTPSIPPTYPVSCHSPLLIFDDDKSFLRIFRHLFLDHGKDVSEATIQINTFKECINEASMPNDPIIPNVFLNLVLIDSRSPHISPSVADEICHSHCC